MIKKIDSNISFSNSGNNTIITYTPSFSEKEKRNIKLKKAIIKLQVEEIAAGYSGGFEVHSITAGQESKLIDYFVNSGKNKTVCIDITNELINSFNSNYNVLNFEIKEGKKITIDSRNSEIIIEYLAIKSIKNAEPTYELSFKKNLSGTIKLITGELELYNHDISNKKNNILPFDIIHKYNSKSSQDDYKEIYCSTGTKILPSSFCGKGWNLNLNQFIVKDKRDDGCFLDDNKTNSRYIYVDSNGSQVVFDERYYYIGESNQKIYLSSKDIVFDKNGKLKTIDGNNNVEIEEMTNSGYTLSNYINDLNGSHIFDVENENIANLRDQVGELKASIKNLQDNLTLNMRQLVIYGMTKEILNKQTLNAENSISMNEKILELQRKISTIQRVPSRETLSRSEIENYFDSNNNITEEGINSVYNAIHPNSCLAFPNDRLCDIIVGESASILSLGIGDSGGSIDLQLMSNDLQKEIYKHTYNETALLEIISQNLGVNILSEISNLSELFKGTDFNNFKFSLKDSLTLDLQIETLLKSNNEINRELKKLNKSYDKLSYQLNILEKSLPVHYISDTNGYTMGFADIGNDIYRLSMIVDNHENVVIFNYEDDKLKTIKINEKESFVFKYNNKDLIKSITNNSGKRVMFEYDDNNNVKNIVYNKNKSDFFYENNVLSAVIDASGYGFLFEYTDNKVSSIKEISCVEKINAYSDKKDYMSEDSIELKDINYEKRNDIKIIYDDYKSVEIIDNLTNKHSTYICDNTGNLMTVYENVFEDENIIGNVKVTLHEMDNIKNKKFVIEPLSNPINYLKDINVEDYYNDTVAEYYLGEDIVCGDDIVLMSFEANTRDNNKYTLSKPITSENKIFKTINLTNVLNDIKLTGKTDFILSGWAKATSAYVSRRLTDYSENNIDDDSLKDSDLYELINDSLDDYKKGRRFELRAELTYDKKVVEQYCSFDWMKTGWQYCALPVTIDQSQYGELKEIKVIFDYSYNLGVAEFYGMTLCEGKWDYYEYDNDGMETYYENSSDNYIRTSKYENKKVIEQKIKKNDIDQAITYEYDGDLLIRTINDSNKMVVENEYNDAGLLTKTYAYHQKDPSSRVYYVERNIDENGLVLDRYNELGEKIGNYSYVSETNVIEKFNDKDAMVYGYDEETNINSITKIIDGKRNSNICQEKYGLVTLLKHNGIGYNYEYDGFGKLTKISINEADYLNINYEYIYGEEELEDGQRVIKGEKAIINFANNEKYIVYLDNDNKVTSIGYIQGDSIEKTVLERQYDTYKNLTVEKHFINEILRMYEYYYDSENRLVGKTYLEIEKGPNGEYNTEDENISNKVQIFNTYENGKLKKHDLDILEYNCTNFYNYDVFERLTNIKLGENHIQNIEYDAFDRIKKITNNLSFSKEYTYLQKDNHVSNLINSEYIIKDNLIHEMLEYKYDKKGNITDIYNNGELLFHYEYDDANRLVRENNKLLNETIAYFYDNGGNIIKKHKWPYSTKSLNELFDGEIFVYKYKVNGFKDQLMKFNDEAFEYDSLGNPVIYRNKNLVWEKGKQLKWFGNDISYEYNSLGVRINKKIWENNVELKSVDFYYDGNVLVGQHDGDLMTFNYGASGIESFTYLGDEYYYKKNILGDIIGIINNEGIEIVKYVYDAYGNHKTYYLNEGTFIDIETQTSYSIDRPLSYEVALENPFRYRGYYYDVETNLYYLISRYYDPQLGRFISMDSVEYLNPDSINGLNLYSYCGNNPIMYSDENGNMPKWMKWVLGGLAVAGLAVATVLTAGVAGAGAAVIGGAMLTGGLVSAGINVIDQLHDGGAFNFTQLAISSLSGTMFGLVMGVTGGAGIGAVAGKLAVAGGTSLLNSWNENKNSKDMITSFVGAIALSGIIQFGAHQVTKFAGNYLPRIISRFVQPNSNHLLTMGDIISNLWNDISIKTGVIRFGGGIFGAIFNDII